METDQGLIEAAYLIDAAGRNSAFVPAAGHRQRNDNLVCVLARLPRTQAALQMARLEAFEHGWWYAAPLPAVATPPQVVVGLFADAAGVHEQNFSDPDVWVRQLCETRHIRPWLDLDGGPPELSVYPAFSSLLMEPVGQNLPYVAAGDAAAARDPLSSSGIANALGTGIQAARVAADALRGQGALRPAYMQALAQDHATYLKAHWKTYAVEQRWPEAPFWRFRNARIRRGPEALIQSKSEGAASIFVPRKIASWIEARAVQPQRQLDLMREARQQFPQIPDERMMLAIEDLTLSLDAQSGFQAT